MIQNQEFAQAVSDRMDTAIHVGMQVQERVRNGNLEGIQEDFETIKHEIIALQKTAPQLDQEESALKMGPAMASILASLADSVGVVTTDRAEALRKIEYELIPLMQDMKMNFFFWGTVFPDAQKMAQYYEKERFEVFENPYIRESEAAEKYKYDLSIVIFAYNKLDYTKRCVNSFLMHRPKNLSYELILVNHGSTDGTKEYFEQIKPDKQLNIAVNGGGCGAIHRITEGKYVVSISNDIIITENAIENLYRCITSDDSIAWVVPATPNVSNYQTIPVFYRNMEEMFAFGKKNNQSDPTRWEQRVRLCNPIDMKRPAYLMNMGYYSYFFSKENMAFPDDKLSLLLRRNGYKLMLAKDAYCHHFGSVTLKDEITKKNEAKFYMDGRIAFQNVFGIDPWTRSFCYDSQLFSRFFFDKTEPVDILGINCGLGSNPLKMKGVLKEKLHNFQVRVVNAISDKRYVADLKGVSDEVIPFQDWKTFVNGITAYDYIVVEEGLEQQFDICAKIKTLFQSMKKDGVLFLLLIDTNLIYRMQIQYDNVQIIKAERSNQYWVILKK